MKTLKTFLLSIVMLFLLFKISVLDNKVTTLEYKNAKLHLMIDDVVNYADFTADTGEFDEFVASPQGERFFTNYREIYDK